FVNPESSGSVDVVFRPDSIGTFTGALHVVTNDGAQPAIRVEVVGTAIGDPVVSVAVGSLDFLAIRVGTTRTLPLVVTNTGGAPLQITPAIVAGTELSLSTTETIVIPALESTTLQLTWAPTIGGPMTGRLSLSTNDPQRPGVDVELLGHGNAPVLSASPAAIDFGRVVQNWQTGAQTFTLTNTGFGELSVNSIVFDPSASSSQIRFVELPPLPFKLQPGGSTSVSLALDATTLGNVSSVVLVGTDSVDGGVSVAGVARLDARGEIVDCNTGCPVSNGEPSCAVTNECRIGSCINRFHDANQAFFDGCECGEDLVPAGGGARRDIDGACGGMDIGALNDNENPKSTTYTGTIHSASDVDVFFFRARDNSQFLNDDYGARVDLLSGPPGLRLFVRFADAGTGCGGENQRSGPVGPGGGLQGRGNSTSDNSEDVTVWVEWTPGVPPMCAEYSVRFRADNDN
ncbi:MAG TPA: choice-of-anchor D domain-containing protein, partial [Myxococcota bacterium]